MKLAGIVLFANFCFVFCQKGGNNNRAQIENDEYLQSIRTTKKFPQNEVFEQVMKNYKNGLITKRTEILENVLAENFTRELCNEPIVLTRQQFIEHLSKMPPFLRTHRTIIDDFGKLNNGHYYFRVNVTDVAKIRYHGFFDSANCRFLIVAEYHEWCSIGSRPELTAVIDYERSVEDLAYSLIFSFEHAINTKNLTALNDILSDTFQITTCHGNIYNLERFLDVLQNIEVQQIPILEFTILPNITSFKNFTVLFTANITTSFNDYFTANFAAKFSEKRKIFLIESEISNTCLGVYNVSSLIDHEKLGKSIVWRILHQYTSDDIWVKEDLLVENYKVIYCVDSYHENITRSQYLEKSKNIKYEVLKPPRFLEVEYYVPVGVIQFTFDVNANFSQKIRAKLINGKYRVISETWLNCHYDVMKEPFENIKNEWIDKWNNGYHREDFVKLIHEDFTFYHENKTSNNRDWFIDNVLLTERLFEIKNFTREAYHLTDIILFSKTDKIYRWELDTKQETMLKSIHDREVPK